jgi:hypothetical protein
MTTGGWCRVCGRSTGVSYWRLCRACFRDETARERAANDDFRREIAEHIPMLLQLAHPDRHDGSPLANRVTAWLLALRKRLPALERAA